MSGRRSTNGAQSKPNDSAASEEDKIYYGKVCKVEARKPLSKLLASVFSIPNTFGSYRLGYTCAHNLAWNKHGSRNGRAGLARPAIDKRSVIYEGELYKVGEKMKVRTQRRAQVYPGLFVYSGAWNAAASNIPLDNAQVRPISDVFCMLQHAAA